MKIWSCALVFLSITCLSFTSIVEHKKQTDEVRTSFYASGWENVSSWMSKEFDGNKIYYYSRSTPELTQDIIDNGIVLSYSKMNPVAGFKSFSKPIAFPFYYLQEGADSYYWNEASPGTITTSFSLNKNMELQNGFQFRYLVISKHFLDEHKLNVAAVRSYNYHQVAELLALKD